MQTLNYLHELIGETPILAIAELPWQKRGLQETATGYGAKLTTRYKWGKYRVYATCYSNAVSLWLTIKGQRYYINGFNVNY